jgi:uncharacterized protein YuzE
MTIRIHPHARERMEEPGATEEEVRVTVESGERFPAQYRRVGFRRNFDFDNLWHNRYYRSKQLEVESIRISDELVVDMAPDGIVYGIGLLNANEQLERDERGGLLVINEETGVEARLPLAIGTSA